MLAGVLTLIAVSGPGQRLEQRLGLPALYLARGAVEPPPGALIIGLDLASVRWLALVAPEFETRAPALAACLGPESHALATMRIPSDLPRALHGCLIELLAERDAEAVVIDIVFNVPREGDTALAAAIERAGRVVLLEGIAERAGTTERRSPRPALARGAAATGSFLVTTRAGDSVSGYRTDPTASDGLADLPALAHRLTGGAPPPRADPQPFWLYGPPGALPALSLRAVHDPDLAGLPDSLAGTTVFVGRMDPGAVGTEDHFTSPVPGADASRQPGVELAATAFLNLRAGQMPAEPPVWARGLVLLTLLGAVFQAALGRPALAALALGTYGAVAVALFSQAVLILPVAMALGAGPAAALLLWLLWRYGGTARRLDAVAPRAIAGDALDPDIPLKEMEASILFCDIVGSTAMAERLGHAANEAMLSRYYALADAEIQATGGAIAELTGDGLMAMHSRPHAGPDHAARAVAAARGIAEGLAAWHGEHGQDAPRLRIGLASGLVSVGRVGTEARHSFKPLGLTVVIASRIEALAREADDGAQAIVLLPASMAEAAGFADAASASLGMRQLRGLADPIEIVRLRLNR